MKCGARARGSQPCVREAEGHRPGQLRGSALSGWTRCGRTVAKSTGMRGDESLRLPRPEERFLRQKSRSGSAGAFAFDTFAQRSAARRCALEVLPFAMVKLESATTTRLRLAALHCPSFLRARTSFAQPGGHWRARAKGVPCGEPISQSGIENATIFNGHSQNGHYAKWQIRTSEKNFASSPIGRPSWRDRPSHSVCQF